MPGHMNVLLAEANVPYTSLYELEQINPEMQATDVAVVIASTTWSTPTRATTSKSPIAGMPIIEVDRAHNVVVLKRGKGKGFSFAGESALLQIEHRDVVWRREIRCLSWRRPCNRRELEMIIAARWRTG